MGQFLLGLSIGLCVAVLLTVFQKRESQKFSEEGTQNLQSTVQETDNLFTEKLIGKDRQIKYLEDLIRQKDGEINKLKLELSSIVTVTDDSKAKNLQKLDQVNAITSQTQGLDVIEKIKNTLSFSPSHNLPSKYVRLQQYLINREWQNADQETSNLLFTIGQFEQSYLEINHYQSLPLQDLAILDGLWTYYSNGLFGFSAQYRLFAELCPQRQMNVQQWQKLGDLLGWRRNQQWVNSPNDLIASLDAPNGQFPFLSYWQGVWLGGFMEGQSAHFTALMARFADVYR